MKLPQRSKLVSNTSVEIFDLGREHSLDEFFPATGAPISLGRTAAAFSFLGIVPQVKEHWIEEDSS
jgi:hypothetical protein